MLSLLTSDISEMKITQFKKPFQTQLPGQKMYFKNRFFNGDKKSDCNSIALENYTKLSGDTPEGQHPSRGTWTSLSIRPKGIS